MIRYQKTQECGCKLQDYGEGNLRIKYCPKHAAADDMLDELKGALYAIYLLTDTDPAEATRLNIVKVTREKIRAVIAQATAPD